MAPGPKIAVCVGGSAGSFRPLIEFIRALRVEPNMAIFICIHRGKNKTEHFCRFLSEQTGKEILEPDDKDPVKFGRCYLAPANYHLTFDRQGYFSLAYETAVNYSRPSIDVMFESASGIFKENTVGVIFSGANADGAKGLRSVRKHQGVCIVENPILATVSTMPLASLALVPDAQVQEPAEMAPYVNLLSKIVR